MRAILSKNRANISLGILCVFLISLFILSSCTQYKATVPAQPTEQEDTCVLLQNAQNPIWVKDATPKKKVAVLTGLIKDRDTLKDGKCAGTEIGINPHRKIITLVMNAEGEKRGEIFIPPTTANSGFMQMVDLATCKAGDIKEIVYAEGNGDSCIYSFPQVEDVAMTYSGQVSATGTVFQSKPFCASTLNITGDATITIFGSVAQVVQNLTRVFGTPGDGCYSGFTDNFQSIYSLNVEKVNGSVSTEGGLKGPDDTYSWSLTGDEQSLSGSFINDHHYCCRNGNHTGTAAGDVTLPRQNQGK